MERPVSRCQSPISVASPNAVSVETPRRHPNRVTTGQDFRAAGLVVDSMTMLTIPILADLVR